MARPLATPEQFAIAYLLYSQKIRAQLISQALEVSFRQPATHRTVENWLKTFRGLSQQVRSMDDTFEWHRLGELSIQPESAEYILRMSASVRESWAQGFVDMDRLPRPSNREVIWWWKIHNANGDMTEYHVWLISWAFVMREIGQDVLGVPARFEDLEAILAYTPWLGTGNRTRYENARDAGRIPGVRTEYLFHDCERVEQMIPSQDQVHPFVLIAVLACRALNNPSQEPLPQWPD